MPLRIVRGGNSDLPIPTDYGSCTQALLPQMEVDCQRQAAPDAGRGRGPARSRCRRPRPAVWPQSGTAGAGPRARGPAGACGAIASHPAGGSGSPVRSSGGRCRVNVGSVRRCVGQQESGVSPRRPRLPPARACLDHHPETGPAPGRRRSAGIVGPEDAHPHLSAQRHRHAEASLPQTA